MSELSGYSITSQHVVLLLNLHVAAQTEQQIKGISCSSLGRLAAPDSWDSSTTSQMYAEIWKLDRLAGEGPLNSSICV